MRAQLTHWHRKAMRIRARARLRRRNAWYATNAIAGMPIHQITMLPAS